MAQRMLNGSSMNRYTELRKEEAELRRKILLLEAEIVRLTPRPRSPSPRSAVQNTNPSPERQVSVVGALVWVALFVSTVVFLAVSAIGTRPTGPRYPRGFVEPGNGDRSPFVSPQPPAPLTNASAFVMHSTMREFPAHAPLNVSITPSNGTVRGHIDLAIGDGSPRVFAASALDSEERLFQVLPSGPYSSTRFGSEDGCIRVQAALQTFVTIEDTCQHTEALVSINGTDGQ